MLATSQSRTNLSKREQVETVSSVQESLTSMRLTSVSSSSRCVVIVIPGCNLTWSLVHNTYRQSSNLLFVHPA
jgi:hypothetical protein